MQPKAYGYIRVSTKDQHTDRQESAMREAGISPPGPEIRARRYAFHQKHRPPGQKLR